MYFEENKINNLLNCKICQRRLEEPKILPCGFTVCYKCIPTECKNFHCDLCTNEHSVPMDGFQENKIIFELLLVKPEKISKCEVIEAFKASLNEIEEKIISLRTGVENGIDYIEQYGLKLKMDAESASKEMIEEINNNNEIIIKKIDDYVEKSINLFVPIDENHKSAFLKTQQELECFQVEWSKYLNNPNKDVNTLLEANKKAFRLIKQAREQKKILDNLVFKENVMVYEKVPNRMLSNSLIYKKFYSFILLENQMNDLIRLCDEFSSHRWILTHRSSKDDIFGSIDKTKDFLVIIKTSDGKIFGGSYGKFYQAAQPLITNQYRANIETFKLYFLYSYQNNEPVKEQTYGNNIEKLSLCTILDDCQKFSNNLLFNLQYVEIFTKI